MPSDLPSTVYDTIGVRDPKNERDFLTVCGLSAAVGHALDEVRTAATVTTRGER